MEIWKDIKGYEGIYQVSNYGRVKVLDRKVWNAKVECVRKGRLFRLNKNSNGYYQISLTKDGKYTVKTIHRLVAEAFLPNHFNLPQVNHIDGNKTNNNVENLEWCTSLENIRHAHKMKLTPNIARKVQKLDKNTNKILCEYKSVHEASIIEKIDETSIRRCCNSVRKSAGGYSWKNI